MSIGEFNEYIKFYNEGIQREKEAMAAQNASSSSGPEFKMAGNSIPGRF